MFPGPRITCFGGVGEVGGNQVLLEEGEALLLLDFGTPYGSWNRFYEEYLRPRPSTGLLDPLVMGLLPPIRGLYREDLEHHGDRLWERVQPLLDLRDRPVAGVLVSHAHLDHCGYVSFLRGDIPVVATAASAFILKSLQDTMGGSEFEREVAYLAPRQQRGPSLEAVRGQRVQRPFALVDAPSLSPEALHFWMHRPTGEAHPQWTPLSGGRRPGPPPHRLGGLEVRFFPVDHSIPGAQGFAVQTSAGWVGYTGDLRLHGRQGGRTRRFVQALAGLRPRLLLCEGTRAGEGPGVTEETVAENCLQAVRGAEGRLVIADFGPRNIERLLTFLEVARLTGRLLVVLAKDAYLLRALHLVDPSVPHPATCPHLAVYRERRDRYDAYFQMACAPLEGTGRLLGPEEVRRRWGEVILCFSFWDMKHLIDLDPPGGLYIYSSSEAYNEEQAMDIRRLGSWLRHFGLRPLGLPGEDGRVPPEEQGFHASGHASGQELLELVREVSPRTLVPIHTEQPRFFLDGLKGTGISVVLPEAGQPITL